MMLSVAQTMYLQMVVSLMNGNLESSWKEVVIAIFEVAVA
jgi:hypothetical protein